MDASWFLPGIIVGAIFVAVGLYYRNRRMSWPWPPEWGRQAERPEPSDKRGQEALGGIGNIPSNMVSKEGLLEGQREQGVQYQWRG